MWVSSLFFALVLLPSSWGAVNSFEFCEKSLTRLVYEMQRGSLGDTENPIHALRGQYGPSFYDRNNPSGAWYLEEDVANMLEVAPESRGASIEVFRDRWGLTEEQALDVLTYYAIHFIEDPRFAGNPEHVFARLREVSRAHYIANSNDPTARRFIFYQANVTQLSVAQMAAQLQTTQGEVYHDLSKLQISINKSFDQALSPKNFSSVKARLLEKGLSNILAEIGPGTSVRAIAEKLVRFGKSPAEAAGILGVGPRALEFFLHHAGVLNRGSSWDRFVLYKGEPVPEEWALVALLNAGNTHAQIAEALNKATQTSPTDPDARTERAVTQKVFDLGLSTESGHGNPIEIYEPNYGYLKKSGRLQPTAVSFIIDNYEKTDEWLAFRLGVKGASLDAFFKRHGIVRVAGKATFQGGHAASNRLNRYAQQRKAVDEWLDWYVVHKRVPGRGDFGQAAGRVPYRQDQLFALNDFSRSGPKSASAVFPSASDAWVAIKLRAKERGISFSLLDLVVRGDVSETFRREMQNEAVERTLAWMKKNPGAIPTKSDFQSLGIDRAQLNGSDEYKGSSRRFFDSAQDAWLRLHHEAERQGTPFQMLDIVFRSSPGERFQRRPELVEIWKRESVDRLLDWMVAHENRQPQPDDWGEGQGKLNLVRARFTGTRNYRSEEEKGAIRIFDSPAEAWNAVWQRASERGVPFALIDVKFDTFPRELIEPIRKEALERVVAWMRQNTRVPEQNDFGPTDGRIDVGTRPRLLGMVDYSPGGRAHTSRLFDSPIEGWTAVRDAAAAAGLPWALIEGIQKKIDEHSSVKTPE